MIDVYFQVNYTADEEGFHPIVGKLTLFLQLKNNHSKKKWHVNNSLFK